MLYVVAIDMTVDGSFRSTRWFTEEFARDIVKDNIIRAGYLTLRIFSTTVPKCVPTDLRTISVISTLKRVLQSVRASHY